jgi:hypothetical protein
MKRSVLAGLAIPALIVAAIILFFVLAGGNATSDREIPGIGNPDYAFTGSDDTLYLLPAITFRPSSATEVRNINMPHPKGGAFVTSGSYKSVNRAK